MIRGKRLAALVPMRHASERVPFKNMRPLGGIPLYRHIVESLLACAYVDMVAIDTDSVVIAREISTLYPSERVLPVRRPDALLGGEVPMTDILLHDVKIVEADLYLQTHATNPFLTTKSICAAVEQFVGSAGRFDSLFSVTSLHVRLWTGDGRALNHDPSVLLRTQDLAPVFEENSNLYIFERSTLERTRRRIGDRPLLFPIDRQEAWDIDEELDFAIAEFLCERANA
jgi:CMP-N-acetylneuraminic acid synthetase